MSPINEINKNNLKVIENYKKHRESLGKAKNTVEADINAIRKLAKSLGKINFKEAKEEDLKKMFVEVKDFVLRDHYASRIICFYKWLNDLKDDNKPVVMKWYKYSKLSERTRQKDPNIKKQLIEAEEYVKIIQKVKMDLRMSALYETLYLSGARPDEICNLKIEDIINDKGKISIMVNKSKTIPREIPLTEKPNLLLRWLENHPYKEDKKSWVFISLDRRFKNRPINASSLSEKFKDLIKDLDVKKTLILYSFRKTRATIMFNQGYDDKEMGLLFGWKPHTVIDRRAQYDLRGLDDLKKKIFEKAEVYKTREQMQETIENLEQKHEKEITFLKNELKEFKKVFAETNLIIIKQFEKDLKLKGSKEWRELDKKYDLDRIMKDSLVEMKKEAKKIKKESFEE